MAKKSAIELTSSNEMSQFLGWISILIGTWVIASTTIDVILSYFSSADATMVSMGIGFICIAAAVVIFGKKKPWA